jgi:CubicO group peptidase (beta-lactamase class C family)
MTTERMTTRTRPARWLSATVLATATLAISAPLRAQNSCPVRPYWPTTEWRSRALEVAAARPVEVKAFEDYAFTLTGTDAERKGIRTDGALIVHRGEIIYERYARGFTASKRHIAWSASKSVAAALTGVAVTHGAVSLGDSICMHLQGVPEDNCGITVQHLLEFSSGLDWAETYENETYQHSSVLAMLYGEGRADMARFVFEHARRDEPGATWQYSTGDTTLLLGAVGAAMSPLYGENWAWTLLFDRIGAHGSAFERDNAGTMAGGSYWMATLQDYARFGYLFLNDGCWAGERLLPEGWVDEARVVPASFKVERIDEETGTDVNGRLWWINTPVPEQGLAKPWPDLPDDTYAALGHWGQRIVVIPSLDLVVVRYGDDREGSVDVNDLVAKAIPIAR